MKTNESIQTRIQHSLPWVCVAMTLDTVCAGACFRIEAVTELWPLSLTFKGQCAELTPKVIGDEEKSLHGQLPGPAGLWHRRPRQLPALYRLIPICPVSFCVNPETQCHSSCPLWETSHVRGLQQRLHFSLFSSASGMRALIFCKYWAFRILYVTLSSFPSARDIYVRKPFLTVAMSGKWSYLWWVID